MTSKTNNSRIIFGLKIKQLRKEKKLSFAELSKKSGLSVSYLNEIEKGKKYPKAGKIKDLATALEANLEELTSSELSRELAPVNELLQSNFLNELPLDLFGIELNKVVEIIASAPIRVGAFISTLVELSKNYALAEENFYHGAMRAYQELHYNFFEHIELQVVTFLKKHQLTDTYVISKDKLAAILEKDYKYTIAKDGLADYPDLKSIRSVFDPKKKKLLLNTTLSEIETTFQYAKELGFQSLKIKERAMTSSILRVSNFEKVLNHFQASYFAAALLINQQLFIKELRAFFEKEKWDGEAFLRLMRKFNASPAMLYLRLTNVIPQFFGIKKLFFLRFVHEPKKNRFTMNKELHLHHKHHPHQNGLREHYCRRWLSLSLLKDLNEIQQAGKYVGTIVGAQRSHYFDTEDEYLCLTLARPGYPNPDQNISVTLGLLIDDNLRENIKFLDDPNIIRKEVNKTCERCPIINCEERAVSAAVVKRKEKFRKIQESLKEILE